MLTEHQINRLIGIIEDASEDAPVAAAHEARKLFDHALGTKKLVEAGKAYFAELDRSLPLPNNVDMLMQKENALRDALSVFK